MGLDPNPRGGSGQTLATEVLSELKTLLTDEDKVAILQNEVELYDDNGLPH